MSERQSDDDANASRECTRDAWRALGVGVPLVAVANAVRRVDEMIGLAAFGVGAIAIVFGVARLISARAKARR